MTAFTIAFSNCNAKSQRYDPRWIIDPPDVLRENHMWEVLVAQLQPGEQVSLYDTAGRAIATARADRLGSAQLSVMLAPATYDGQLSVIREAAPGGEAPDLDAYAAIDVKQTQLLERGAMELSEPPLASAVTQVGNHSVAFVVQPSGVAIYDISQPESAQFVQSVAVPGLAGVLDVGEAVAGWGERGIIRLAIDEAMELITVDQVTTEPVLGMARAGGRLFTLMQDRVDVWDGLRDRVATLDAPRARTVAASATHLLVGTEDVAAIYELTDELLPSFAGGYPCHELTAIAVSPLAPNARQFLLQQAMGGQLIDVADPQQVLVISESVEPMPLFALQLYGDLLIETDSAAMTVRLLGVGDTRWM